jgi:hypothetical protein
MLQGVGYPVLRGPWYRRSWSCLQYSSLDPCWLEGWIDEKRQSLTWKQSAFRVYIASRKKKKLKSGNFHLQMRRKIHGFEESAAMFIRCLGMRCSPK